MFVLEPVFHKTIWGGDRLVSVYGKQAAGMGHLYSLRCKDENSNIILNGKYAGKHLYNIIGEYPLSLAIVDAAQNLSIQVHPGGSLAKYESYFFIEAPKSGYIYCGIDNMSRFGQLAVQSGDYIFIEPCTVHALTAGSLVYEIEQGEDNTYRLFDYNRTDADGNKRDLQIEEAVDVLEPSLKAKPRKYQSCEAISEKTYSTEFLTNIKTYVNTGSAYGCLTLLSGEAVIDGVPLKMGMTVLLESGEKLEGLAIEQCIAAHSLI